MRVAGVFPAQWRVCSRLSSSATLPTDLLDELLGALALARATLHALRALGATAALLRGTLLRSLFRHGITLSSETHRRSDGTRESVLACEAPLRCDAGRVRPNHLSLRRHSQRHESALRSAATSRLLARALGHLRDLAGLRGAAATLLAGRTLLARALLRHGIPRCCDSAPRDAAAYLTISDAR